MGTEDDITRKVDTCESVADVLDDDAEGWCDDAEDEEDTPQMPVAVKNDWKTSDMPDRHEEFPHRSRPDEKLQGSARLPDRAGEQRLRPDEDPAERRPPGHGGAGRRDRAGCDGVQRKTYQPKRTLWQESLLLSRGIFPGCEDV